MEAITYTAVRKNLAQTMKKTCEDHNPIIITRQAGEPVVLLSLEDYQSLEETAHLLRHSKNTVRLTEAIEEIEAGKAKERELME